MRLGAEYLRIGPKAHLGAAAVRRLAGVLQFALRLAALERHPVEFLAARDLDLHALGQRIRHRNADAVQAAGRPVNLGIEFAAGVQRAHDHFERGLVLEFRMRIDRNAAAIVGDGDKAVRLHLDLDPVGVTGERLVHGVVDHLGKQVMQRLLVGAADIHAGPAAHRLEPLQNLDVLGGIAGLAACRARRRRAARRAMPRRRFGASANRSRRFRDSGFDDLAVFPTAFPMWRVMWRLRLAATQSGESAATMPATMPFGRQNHQRQGRAALTLSAAALYRRP